MPREEAELEPGLGFEHDLAGDGSNPPLTGAPQERRPPRAHHHVKNPAAAETSCRIG